MIIVYNSVFNYIFKRKQLAYDLNEFNNTGYID
jgi:hypothetical protein